MIIDGLSIKDTIFAFLDIETTGLDPRWGDKVCEVAILRTCNACNIDSFHSLIDPGREISPGAYAVNGITPAMLRGKPKFGEIAPKILEFLEGTVIVCHNAPFDPGFLEVELSEVGLCLPNCLIVDTLTLARRCFNFWSNSLGNVAKCLGIEISQEHRAMGDVLTTQKVFQKFIEDFHRRGVTALSEVLALQKEPSWKRGG